MWHCLASPESLHGPIRQEAIPRTAGAWKCIWLGELNAALVSQLRREEQTLWRAYGSLRDGCAAVQPLTAAHYVTEKAQLPPARGCPPIFAAHDCMASSDSRLVFRN